MSKPTGKSLEKRRRAVESTATFGLLLVAAALVVPFANLTDSAFVSAFKWVYAAGALIYTVARCVDVTDPGESKRLKRLRRMEAWAGFAFCIGAAFWFYNAHRYGEQFGYTLTILRDTITFTLVGAAIQIIGAWMIYSRTRREAKEGAERGGKKESGKK